MSDTLTQEVRDLLVRFFDPAFDPSYLSVTVDEIPIYDPEEIGGQYLGAPTFDFFNGNPDTDGSDANVSLGLFEVTVITDPPAPDYGWHPFKMFTKGSEIHLTPGNAQITTWILDQDIAINNPDPLPNVTHIRYGRGDNKLLLFTLDKPTTFRSGMVLPAGCLRFTLHNGFKGFRILFDSILGGLYPTMPVETPFFEFHHEEVNSDYPLMDDREYFIGEDIDMGFFGGRLINEERLTINARANTRPAFERTLLGVKMLYNADIDPDENETEYEERLCAYCPFPVPIAFENFCDYTFEVGSIQLAVR